MEKIIKKLVSKLIKGKTEKASKEIISTVMGYLIYDGISIELLENFTEDCEKGKIWSSTEFLDTIKDTTYNIFDYLINKNYLPIIKSLMWAKPILGSPNAATGDYEIMFLITIPELVKPTQGDIQHPYYGKKNLKGNNPRLYCEVYGKDLNKIMLSELKKYNVLPKMTKGIPYGQLLNENYINKHFNDEFQKIDIINVKDILSTWMVSLFPSKKISKTNKEISKIIDYCLVGGRLDWGRWLKENLIFIFKNSENKNESFLVVSDCGKLTHLLEDINSFIDKLENNKIEMYDNYFRLNQSTKCGVYLKFN
jgi:hypothetical protein